ncbi:hypothetical protein ABZ078_36920 [Streptomyces sp. NPDC006385]|uniref:hypothetical protein n=1 Tax=Streptomyces sp. NPDC006385 TaxID=3156761 RepID=UPI0033B755A1
MTSATQLTIPPFYCPIARGRHPDAKAIEIGAQADLRCDLHVETRVSGTVTGA